MSAVTLDYRPPSEGLREIVSLFYDFHADVPLFEDDERADLAQVRFMLAGGDGIYRFPDGHEAPAPRIAVVGPTTGATHVCVKGPVHVFGCGMLARGWALLVDYEASLVVNRVLDGSFVFGGAADEVWQALKNAETLDHRVAIGERVAADLIVRGRGASTDFTRMVDDWLQSAPSPDVDELVRVAGVTRRQVERSCKRYYGAPPKVLARKYRALRAAIALAKGAASADALLAEGFYDQSHLIREVKAFTGVTPRKFAEDLPTLAQLTMQRTEIEGLNPLVTGT